MRIGKKNTVISVLVLLGIFAGFTDVFARTTTTRRRTTGSRGSSSSSSSSAALVPLSSTSLRDPVEASPSATTTTTTTTTALTTEELAVLETQEAETLKYKLQDCVRPYCDGEIPYEKCFSEDVGQYLAVDETCQTYLNSASSDNVRNMARASLESSIESYFTQACNDAGGKKVGTTKSGGRCKFEIYYVAKSPEEAKDGKIKTVQSNSRTFYIDDTVTCSYSAFGLSAQQMEYEQKASIEQQMAMTSSVIEAVMGGLTTTFAIVDAVQTNNELKEADQTLGNIIYAFNGTSLNEACAITRRKYGKEKDLKKDPSCAALPPKSDIAGHYCETGSDCSIDWDDALCSSAGMSTKTPKDLGSKPCYVQIDNANEIKRMEKQSELVKKHTKFDELQDMAYREDQANAIRGYASQVQLANSLNSFTGGGGSTGGVEACNITKKSMVYGTSNVTIEQELQSSNSGAYDCSQIYAGQYICISVIDKQSGCSWNSSAGTYTKRVSGGGTTGSVDPFQGMVDSLMTDKTADGGDNWMYKSNTHNNAYNTAMTNYNTNQTALNDAKQGYDDLKERADSSVQGAISSGTQLLLNSGTKIATTAMEMGQNKGVMTGNCYLGNPAEGNMILSDQQAKKIGWTTF